jgi:putative membrane protein
LPAKIDLPAGSSAGTDLGNQMRYVGVCVLAAAAAVFLATTAHAQHDAEPGPAAGPDQPQPRSEAAPARPAMFAAASAANARKMSAEQREERRFLKEAAANSRFESDASRLAFSRASDPAVRAFAADLVSHHASAGPALQSMLHGRGMAPPMLGNDQRKALNRLARLSGAKFDREYIQQVGLKQRQSSLQAYERAGAAAREPTLKAWIAQTLPMLRHQLAAAGRIAAPQAGLAPNATSRYGVAAARHAAAPREGQAPNASRANRAPQFMGSGSTQQRVARPVATQN